MRFPTLLAAVFGSMLAATTVVAGLVWLTGLDALMFLAIPIGTGLGIAWGSWLERPLSRASRDIRVATYLNGDNIAETVARHAEQSSVRS